MKFSLYLWVIVFIGLGLRLWFVFISDHIYHPDEIFQTLEPAYKLVYGYGLEPWDFTYGLRSFLTPYFLALPLQLLKSLGLNHPTQYVKAIQFFLSLLSLSVIPALYLITKRFTKNKSVPLLAAFYGAVWYELIYFAPRALTEVFAVYLFAFGIIALYIKKPHYSLTGFFLTLGTLLRPQYFLIPLIFIFLGFSHHLKKSAWVKACIGAGLVIILYGVVDLYTLGTPFISLINNIKLSFLSGISREFGVSPWYFYLQAVIITSCALILISFRHLKINRLRILYATYLGVLILHSLIPHKEYRFIFILIPLFLILLSLTFKSIKPWFTVVACLISLLGILGRLPYQYRLYRFSPLAKDSLLSLLPQTVIKGGCGLYLPDRGWVTSGGLYRLGANLPIYTFDYAPPSSTSANLIIAPRPIPPQISSAKIVSESTGFAYLTHKGRSIHPGYLALEIPSTCAYDSSYSYLRSFAYLKSYLIYAKKYLTPQ